MHAPAHALLVAFALICLSCATTRLGAAILRFVLAPMRALWIVSAAVGFAWVSYTGAWRTVDWSGVAYFAVVSTLTFTALAILWQVYKTLKRWLTRTVR